WSRRSAEAARTAGTAAGLFAPLPPLPWELPPPVAVVDSHYDVRRVARPLHGFPRRPDQRPARAPAFPAPSGAMRCLPPLRHRGAARRTGAPTGDRVDRAVPRVPAPARCAARA